ncbi:uncharacterized protein LOC132619715 [Lycium barbarum]|uniref:uncharacterized protein LOC132619715 n=1 Tax=Lycium barbarum TaxID=112863 RepID=UPI00293E826D|nr:uncharacterized protein LOC132619715 [Lycium barbarum]
MGLEGGVMGSSGGWGGVVGGARDGWGRRECVGVGCWDWRGDNQREMSLMELIEEGRKADHQIEIKETNGQDQLVLQTKKSSNQLFDERFKDLDNTCIRAATIFKVNVGLQKSNPDAYMPFLISIGPYHKRNPELGSMEKYKLLYLRRFLRRKEGLDMESCISTLEKKKDEALKCYDDNLDSDTVCKFSEMLLLDGCFVVEFIREHCEVEKREDGDKIINLQWMMDQVCRDMVLLENQLPFFVLTMLHDMKKHRTEASFLYMVRETLLNTFPKVTLLPRSEIDDFNAERVDHLVHAVHMFCRPSEMKTTNASMRSECCKISSCGKILQLTRSKEIPNVLGLWQCYHIPSATELYDAGVSFLKIGSEEENDVDKTTLFDFKFENELMEFPCFTIEDSTDTFMRNLIAYEQHSSNIYPYFSNYAHIMTQLIRSHKDVNLLRQTGIILNDLGDDKEVANIFKKLSNGVTVTDFFYREECSKLIQHCEKPWNQMMASLRHNYLQSPWAGASTMAAIILLILTVIQTVLAFTGDQELSISVSPQRIKNILSESQNLEDHFGPFLNFVTSPHTTPFEVGESNQRGMAHCIEITPIDDQSPLLRQTTKDENPELGSMEKYKLLYQRRFLRRKAGLDVESCISELEKLEDKALKCYVDIGDVDSDIVGKFSETKGVDEVPFTKLQVVHMSSHPSYWSPRRVVNHNMKNMSIGKIHQTWHANIPNVTELCEAGVRFSKVGNIYSDFGDSITLFDIKFENGLMKISWFEVDDITETLLRNLIAYKQQSYDELPKHFSDFAVFMDYLINSNKDVNLLRRKGIITNQLGEDNEVASIFNKIGQGVNVSTDFYYEDECRKAIHHCEKTWNRMKANFRRNYLHSPWAGISTVAAIILLLLTATQTVLSFISLLK